ncbi:LacI family DNA-binding transcriptional regulator [Scatolibacter rhodanostii]|uniref:LacI family DNA-binding transcriptional regulator n=1 Tax=Scatolibacter rhodanostii TaxID=2014781 RepID=UPI000C07FC52|nr:LacI family DNA-binding transcriptional regulator [Scatolibacter rhodanostii]
MSTIRDVAKLAQVSTATVSRVINNDSTYKMTEATKNRVWEAVRALNYKMNSRANSVSPTAIKTNVKIGCVISVTKDKYNDPYFMSILSGVEARLQSKGYQLAFVRSSAELEDTAILHSVFQEQVAGLILMESLEAKTYEYIRKQVPCIVGIDTRRPEIDNVGYDHYEVATNAVQYLIEKGHTRIGFVGGNGVKNSIKDSLRYKGYYATMHAAGLPVHDEWVINCQWDEVLCMEKIAELCLLKEKPTALFVASDLMAIAALSSLYANGVSVPKEMAVIGLSNIEMARYSNPPLTTLEIPMKEVGMLAVDVLLNRMSGDDLLPRKLILPTTLIERNST